MIEVSVCIGSSCHLKGSYAVIKRLQELIDKHSLNDKAVIKAAFCLGHCAEGVSVMVGDRYIGSVNAENVDNFFNTFILGDA